MGLYDKFVGEVGDSFDCSKRELEFKRCYSRDGQYYFPLPLKTRQDDKIGRWASGDEAQRPILSSIKSAMKRAAIRLVADDLSISI
jgi:hypothetical protein